MSPGLLSLAQLIPMKPKILETFSKNKYYMYMHVLLYI